MAFRNRITGFRNVLARELRANPRNWRTHPEGQRAALNAVLEEVGIAGALIARETDAGLELIDGHLRADGDPDEVWPVLVLDVDETEVDKLLATLDPIAAMAGTDANKLEDLLAGLDTDNEALQQMLGDLAAQEGIKPPDFEPVDESTQGQLDEKKPIQCPECGHEFTT